MFSSSSSKKRFLKRPSETTVVYIHDLLPSQDKQKQHHDVANSVQQNYRSTLYSPHERPVFAQSQDSRTPLKPKDHTYMPDKSKIVINNMTDVTTPHHSEYSFQYIDITPPKANQDPISI